MYGTHHARDEHGLSQVELAHLGFTIVADPGMCACERLAFHSWEGKAGGISLPGSAVAACTSSHIQAHCSTNVQKKGQERTRYACRVTRSPVGTSTSPA